MTITSERKTSQIDLQEVQDHDDPERGFWVIVDSYVLDLTKFLRHHPSGAQKIVKRRNKSIDIGSNFLDHFAHTVRTFREACSKHDATGQVVSFRFKEVDQYSVSILGKVDPSSLLI